MKRAPRQMEATSPSFVLKDVRGEPKSEPWGTGRFHGGGGRGGLGVIGGGCLPVLCRIYPHQLQIKGVNIVALEEDGTPVLSRAQRTCSPTSLARLHPQAQPTGTLLDIPRLLGPTGPELSPSPPLPVPHLQGSSSIPLHAKAWPGTWDQPPYPPHPAPSWPPEWSSGNAAQALPAPVGNLTKASSAWGMETSLLSLTPGTTHTTPSSWPLPTDTF